MTETIPDPFADDILKGRVVFAAGGSSGTTSVWRSVSPRGART
jgi:hypothetical protein